MKKMRCSSCGAELKVEDNNEYAVCEHCGSKYKMNEDLNINIKIDDNVKDVIKSGGKAFSKFMLIPLGIGAIGFIAVLVFAFTATSRIDKTFNETKQQIEDTYEEGKENVEDLVDEGEKQSFNFQFTTAAGTKNGIRVRGVLDDIIESNKTKDRTVTLIYNGKSVTDETEIINIKHELGDWDDYEVIVNYDDKGYVNEIKVDKIA